MDKKKKDNNNIWKTVSGNFIIWILIIIMAITSLQFFSSDYKPKTITYSQFQLYIDDGMVESGKVVGRTFKGKFKEPVVIEDSGLREPKQYSNFNTVLPEVSLEMTQKWEALPKDIEWHMIGNLQRNKIKYMAEYVSLIHGVENFKTLQEINKQALKHDRIINCLLQIKIAKEDTKAGMTLTEAKNILCSEEFSNMKNVHVNGLMGMATFTENKEQLNDEFNSLKTYSEELKELDSTNCNLQTISMGMSGDYTLAINCGSTMVRVGSSIFGVRNYKI